MSRFFFFFVAFFSVLLFPIPFLVSAEDLSSTNYTVRDPVLAPGEYGTSTTFRLYGSIGELSIGTSTSIAFGDNSGFLFFPTVTLPVPTATAGDTTVALSWSASTGFLGWTVSGYTIGYSAISGGPYTYSSVGAVLSASVGGLTNGTPYYFVVRAQDFFGNYIATSTEATATPIGGGSGGGGGGGGGNGPPIPIVIPPLTISLEEIIKEYPECTRFADLNCDGYVDIVDFSIMYYWYGKGAPPVRVDLKKDGVVNIFDFSVMAYYWHEKVIHEE